MSKTEAPISAVPTNVITGFLGVGKTSAILHLLKSKPAAQPWAVLVNEFGEIGIDGSLFSGEHRESNGVFIREVPGGCMCCAAGLPMQIALNQLLRRAKPSRLLIEPTGLGHPKEVLQVLSSEHYQAVISLQKILTLVDARQLSDTRYTQHTTFNQQIAIADTIVGNKLDLYSEQDTQQLNRYIEQHGAEHANIVFTQNGELNLELLEGKTQYKASTCQHSHGHSQSEVLDAPEPAIPETGFLKAENQGEGFFSIGWRFSPAKTFDRSLVKQWLSALNAERVKGVFITSEGIFAYNFTPDTATEIELDDCLESRVEIISRDKQIASEEDLLQCLVGS